MPLWDILRLPQALVAGTPYRLASGLLIDLLDSSRMKIICGKHFGIHGFLTEGSKNLERSDKYFRDSS